jgi:putative chitinase
MTLKNLLKRVKSAESSISTLLGVIVVIAIGATVFNYFKNRPLENKEETGEVLETSAQENQNNLPSKYVVVSGDNLWKISEKFYNSGYNWVDIQKANNLKNPDQLVEGQEITVPLAEPKIQTVAVAQSQEATTQNEAISGTEYTIKTGDNLWEISVRAYQDGYKWTEVAKANNLEDPNIIHPGNKPVLPR